jgi:hypothetical protein
MTPPLALWALPFVLVLLGVALFFGHFSLPVAVFAAAATMCAIVYITLGDRVRRGAGRPMANLLALLPGHLLLLFGLGTLPRPDLLGLAWGSLPLGSVVYDWVSARRPFPWRRSILTGLYAIIWLVVFFLLERLVAERKGLSGHAEIVAAVAFGAIGVVFVVTGVARHRRAVKE